MNLSFPQKEIQQFTKLVTWSYFFLSLSIFLCYYFKRNLTLSSLLVRDNDYQLIIAG